MRLSKIMMGLAAVAAPIALAAPANAAQYVVPNTAPSSYTFGNTGGLGRTFTNIFNFLVTSTGLGTVSVLANGAGRDDVDFTSLSLTGPGLAAPLTTGAFTGDPGDTGLLSFSGAPGTYQLTVRGTAASRTAYYTGGFSVANAVPEPAAWAMMIGGFGIAGGALRRRRASSMAVSYS